MVFGYVDVSWVHSDVRELYISVDFDVVGST